MKKRFITSIFIVLFTVLAVVSKLLPHRIGDYIFDIFIVGVMFVASYEMGNIMNRMNKKVNLIFSSFYTLNSIIHYSEDINLYEPSSILPIH